MTRKMVSKMTYNVSSGMLNLLYHTILIQSTLLKVWSIWVLFHLQYII